MVIPTFGGGLDFSKNPAALEDHQWSWCQNIGAENGCAGSSMRYTKVVQDSSAYPAGLAGKNVFGILPNPFDVATPLLLLAEDPTAYPRRVYLYRSNAPID